jgi:hypothetical protein
MNKTSICYCRHSPLRGAEKCFKIDYPASRPGLLAVLRRPGRAIRSRSGRLIDSGGQHFTCCKSSINSIGFQFDDGRNRHQHGSGPHSVLDGRGYRVIRAQRDFREDIGGHCVGAATRAACRPFSKTGT